MTKLIELKNNTITKVKTYFNEGDGVFLKEVANYSLLFWVLGFIIGLVTADNLAELKTITTYVALGLYVGAFVVFTEEIITWVKKVKNKWAIRINKMKEKKANYSK